MEEIHPSATYDDLMIDEFETRPKQTTTITATEATDKRGEFEWSQLLPYDTTEDKTKQIQRIHECLSYKKNTNSSDTVLKNALFDKAKEIEKEDEYKQRVLLILEASHRLSNFIKIGYILPLKDRLIIVKRLWELIFSPDKSLPDLIRVECMSTFAILTSKKRIPLNELELSWRPLLDYLQKIAFKNTTTEAQKKMITHLADVIVSARRFFSLNTVSQVMNTFMPLLFIYDERVFTKNIGLISLFFPTFKLHLLPEASSNTFETTTGNSNNIRVSNKFFETSSSNGSSFFTKQLFVKNIKSLISIWFVSNANSGVDAAMIDLLFRIGKGDIQLLNNILDRESIHHMFSICSFYLGLPFAQSRAHDSSTKRFCKVNTFQKTFAKLLILLAFSENNKNLNSNKNDTIVHESLRTIGIDQNSNDSLSKENAFADVFPQLIQYLTMLEVYFHPSNSGKWSAPLNNFLSDLCHDFVKRIKKSSNCDFGKADPSQYSKMSQQFVKVVIPIFMESMFGKTSSESWKQIIKCLLQLDPKQTMKHLFEVVYPSLESPLQTHRTIASINVLKFMTQILCDIDTFPDGPAHMTNFLFEVLPGLDINDILKANSSIQFYSSVSRNIFMGQFSPPITSHLSDQLIESYDATKRFEDWLVCFLDRLFRLIENLPATHIDQNKKTYMPTKESAVCSFAMIVWSRLSYQLSEPLLNIAVQKVKRWIQSECYPNAIDMAGYFCYGLASRFSEKTLSELVPVCIKGIRQQMEDLEHSNLMSTANLVHSHPFGMQSLSDAKLHWYQHILLCLLSQSGETFILKHGKDLKVFVNFLMETTRTRRAYKWTAKLVRRILESLLDVYPNEHNSFIQPSKKQGVFSTDVNSAFSETIEDFSSWGQWMFPEDSKLEFRSPSQQAEHFALDFIVDVINHSISQLNQLLDGISCTSSPDYHTVAHGDIVKWISFIRNVIKAAPYLFQDQVGFDLTQGLNIGTNWIVLAESELLRTAKTKLMDCFLRLLEVTRQNFANEQVSIQTTKLCFTWLYGTFLDKSKISLMHFAFRMERDLYQLPFKKKLLPRSLHIERVFILHKRRMALLCDRYSSKETRFSKSILHFILENCFSSFSLVSKMSIDAVSSAIQIYRWSIPHVHEHILNQLESLLQRPLSSITDEYFLGLMQLIANGVVADTWRIYNPDGYLKAILLLFKFGDQTLVKREMMSKLAMVEMLKRFVDLKSCVQFESVKTALNELSKMLDTILSKPSDLPSYTEYALECVHEIISVDYKLVKPILIERLFQCALSSVKQVRQQALHVLRLLLRLMKSAIFNDIKFSVSFQEWESRRGELRKDDLKWGSLHQPTDVHGCYQSNYSVDLFFKNDDKKHQYILSWFSPVLNAGYSETYWEQLLKYLSDEDVNRGHFSKKYYKVFKNILQICGPKCLDIIKPHIYIYAQNIEDTSAQKIASELMVGLFGGMKYWSRENQDYVFSWLVPFLDTTIKSATNEGFIYWAQGLKRILGKKDPYSMCRIIQWISELALDPNPTSFFAETKNLTLKGVLMETTLGLSDTIPSHKWLIVQLLPCLNQDFGQVRVKMAQMLQLYLCIPGSFGGIYSDLNLQDILVTQTPYNSEFKHGTLGSQDVISLIKQSLIKKSQELVTFMVTQYQALDHVKEKKKMCKTWILLLKILMSRGSPGIVCFSLCEALTEFGPHIFTLAADEDKEFGEDVDSLLDSIKYVLLPPPIQVKFLNGLSNLLEMDTIAIPKRVKLLSSLQSIIGQHALSFDKIALESLFKTTLLPLLSLQEELGQAASMCISIFARSYDHYRDAICRELESILSKTPFDKKKTTHDQILIRHGALIGLAAIIQAHPFTIPMWMPRILMILAASTNQPAPIKTALKKFFLDFKKSHQETWHLAKNVLTEDEYFTLNELLVSPSHYI